MPERQYRRDNGGKFSSSGAVRYGQGAYKRVRNGKLDAADAGVAVGAVAGFKAGSYAKGAVALRRLTPERAAKVSQHMNRNTERKTMQDTLADLAGNPANAANPFYLHGQRRASVKGMHARGGADRKLKRETKNTQKAADAWADTMMGVRHSRRVAEGKWGRDDILFANHRPKHKYMGRVVENSGDTTVPLYRGMSGSRQYKVGDTIDMDQSSWSSDPSLAAMYAARGKGSAQIFQMDSGKGRATNISGVTRTVQSEHVAPKSQYRVTGIGEDGTIQVEQIRKRYIPMSDHELKARKKAQAYASRTTGALGLAAVGTTLASTKKGGQLIARGAKAAGRNGKHVRQRDYGKATMPLLTTSGGVGGAAAFNSASISSAEARKRPVRKNMDWTDVAPTFGESSEISKVGEWKTIHQREQTQRRDRKVQGAAGAGVTTGAGLVALGVRSGDDKTYKHAAKGVKAANDWRKTRNGLDDLFGNADKAKRRDTNVRAVKGAAKAVGSGAKSLSPAGKGGLAVAGGSAAVYGGAKSQQTYNQHKINQRRRARVKKSAFGVDHNE